MSNQTDLEKKIEEAAENFKLSDISYPPLKNIFKAGCKHGYTLGREEMLQEVLEYLRSDEAPRNMGGLYPYNQSWSDWLESKFKGKT